MSKTLGSLCAFKQGGCGTQPGKAAVYDVYLEETSVYALLINRVLRKNTEDLVTGDSFLGEAVHQMSRGTGG